MTQKELETIDPLYRKAVSGFYYLEAAQAEVKRLKKIYPNKLRCVADIEAGKEIMVRIAEQIWLSGDGHYIASQCTAKDYRGVSVFLNFDDMPLASYPNNKEYFNVVDPDGNVLKVINKYCIITGTIIHDIPIEESHPEVVKIKVKSLKLA